MSHKHSNLSVSRIQHDRPPWCVTQHVTTAPWYWLTLCSHICIFMWIVGLYLHCSDPGALVAHLFFFFFQQRSHQVFSICSLLYWHQHWTLTQLFLRGPFFHKGDSLQDSPEHHTQGEDVSLGCVGQSTPHLRSHVEVRATGGGEVLPRQVSIQQTFTHLAQTKVCHLENGQEQSLK